MSNPAPDPAHPWAGRGHADLAALVRELLLAGHLIDRAGMPQIIARHDRGTMTAVAIDEWMGASPVYTARMARLLGITGSGVSTIFKGMQLDIGAPPGFMDFRYQVDDEEHGSFHLRHCGALMDVEPMGEEYVTAMCHHIEDPTFDATAAATNPRARMLPLHRPPRVPADRSPHCAWTVSIDAHREALALPRAAEAVAMTQAAGLAPLAVDGELSRSDGDNDYGGPLDPELRLDRFSSATLSAIADEVRLQGQLLNLSFGIAVQQHCGTAATTAIGIAQAKGVSGLVAKRLQRALDADADLAGLAAVLAAHPTLGPRPYVDLRLAATDDELIVALGPCPALAERLAPSWAQLLVGPGGHEILEAIVSCVAAHSEIVAETPEDDEVARWRIVPRPGQAPLGEPDEVALTEFSTGATFEFPRVSESRE